MDTLVTDRDGSLYLGHLPGVSSVTLTLNQSFSPMSLSDNFTLSDRHPLHYLSQQYTGYETSYTYQISQVSQAKDTPTRIGDTLPPALTVAAGTHVNMPFAYSKALRVVERGFNGSLVCVNPE
ncbi:hypothetical protein KIPB_012053, partial [Kipferlia bialata]|eukprot:g12053.t1